VTKYSVNTVLAELARCIALFPNLHTVQLGFRFNSWFNSYRSKVRVDNPFTTYQYPSIKNVYICPMSVMILRACPEARIVAPLKWHESSWWPRSIFDVALRHCPALEVLGPFVFEKRDMRGGPCFPLTCSYPDSPFLLAIARKLPKLREISLPPVLLRSGFVRVLLHEALDKTKFLLFQKYISDLSELRHLCTINIIIRPFQEGAYTKPIDVTLHEVAEWLQWAKGILSQGAQNSEDDRPRKVVVHYERRSPVTHLVNLHENQ